MTKKATKSLRDERRAAFSERTQIAIARCELRFKGVAFVDLTREQLDYAMKNAGTPGAAFIWGTTEQRVRERVAELRGVTQLQRQSKRVRGKHGAGEITEIETPAEYAKRSRDRQRPQLSSSDAYTEQQGRRLEAMRQPIAIEPPRVVVQPDDLSQLVPLMKLPSETRFRLPLTEHDIAQGLRSKSGVLLHANDCRARVRYDVSPRTFAAKRVDSQGGEYEVELSFQRSGEVDISARTMVLVVSEPTS